MWCLSCFKPSTSEEDPFEAEIDLALAVSREEADTQEAQLLASALQESSRLHQRLVDEQQRMRRRELERDEQIAHAIKYDEREMQLRTNSALEEHEQPAKSVVGEQVNNDEELALVLQESLNMVEPPLPPPHIQERQSVPSRAALDVEDHLAKEKGKGKLIEDEQVKDDEQLAAIVQESLNMVDPPTELEERSNIEQRIIWESLNKGKGQIKNEVEENGKMNPPPPPPRMRGGCNTEIGHGRSVVDVLGVLWHPDCLHCDACDKPIPVHEVNNHVSNSRGKFHNACYGRYCYVCKERKMRNYSHHPFWEERYCSAHESDGTPKCCSCERLEAKGRKYVKLGDGRWLCLECMESAVMDSDEAVPLHFEIRDFFDGLNMKIEKHFPFFLVEKQALNKAEQEEKIDYQYEVVTRGICLSEAQTVTKVSKRPRMGPQNQLIDMVTESEDVPRHCEVTAILILYGLPRVMTGYILAHEVMHAYLRLKGYRKLDHVLEEGICQVLGHMWLESQTYATIDDATAASTSHTRAGAATASKKGACSAFEKRLVEFCKNQIETDDSQVYGVGFREVNKMVSNSSLNETLKKIVRHRG